MTAVAAQGGRGPGGRGVDGAMARALADEMVALTARLADLAYDLGSVPDTLRRHMASLQAVDEITQRQLAIADVLRSDAAIDQRVATITLESLRESLAARHHRYATEG